MEDSQLNLLATGNEDDVRRILNEFNDAHTQTFKFPDMDIAKKKKLLDAIFVHLQTMSSKECQKACLETIRILSRDKVGLNELFTRDKIDVMVHLAGLVAKEEDAITRNIVEYDTKVILEAQKSLCNLIFNSTSVQRICCSNGCVEGIILRLKTYMDPAIPYEVKFFDMRMLFLLTALCADIRPKLRNNLHGLTYLMEVLDLIIKDCTEAAIEEGMKQLKSGKKVTKARWKGRHSQDTDDNCFVPCLDNNNVDLACEVLKVLFNLTVNLDKFNLEEEEEAHFLRLVTILHDILLCNTKSREKKDELQSHTVDLLTNMPPSSYEELLTPVVSESSDIKSSENEFEGMNMEAVIALLDFLDMRLSNQSKRSMKESLSPILTCLSECARSNRTIRKFLRNKVLPPLKDVMNRPEEGTTVRNRLVKLMTSPVTDVKELVANFLFILCKENVGRLIKYTGYGNAAGLLANRGLMLGGKGTGDYSSESEDSDTEEYLKYKDKINPVIGCYEDPRPNPLEGMSEEQKEYEAMQLVNMMDKLARDGIVQPMRVGEDGKPHPIEHILELQEGHCGVPPINSDSSSD